MTTIRGTQFVKIPSPRVWKLRQEIEIKECVHDGSEVLTENQQADTFVSMTKELFGQPAAGNAMTLDALLSSRNRREEAAAPSHTKQAALLPTSTAASGSAASSSSCSNPFGTGGAFGSLGGTEVLPTDSSVPGGAEPKASPKAKGKAAAKSLQVRRIQEVVAGPRGHGWISQMNGCRSLAIRITPIRCGGKPRQI